MPTILQNNILDDLLSVVDDLRGDLNANFGTRPYNMTVIIRTYAGTKIGQGAYTDTDTSILPAPQVEFLASNNLTMNGSGKYSTGDIRLSLISLTYSQDQLLPQNLLPNQQLFYKLTDIHGENARDRYFKPKDVPVMDRDHSIGWIIYASEVQGRDSNINGVL